MTKTNSDSLEASCRARFVVLFHQFSSADDRQDHWDLMLEWDGRLLTWALEGLPEPGKTISARQLPDHRLRYLRYEGPVSGERGRVNRVLGGYYFPTPKKSAPDKSSRDWYHEKKFRVLLEIVDQRWWARFESISDDQPYAAGASVNVEFTVAGD